MSAIPPRSLVPYVTVDSPSSRDLDDAIHVRCTPNGWLLHVAIAAPSLHVPVGSAVDSRALAQAATIYAGTSVKRPMLPAELSESLCTLSAGRLSPALEVSIEIERDGQAYLREARLATIEVGQRLAYEDVASLAKASGSDDTVVMAREAIALSDVLFAARKRSGGVAFRDVGRLIYLDEEGRLRHVGDVNEMAGHLVVQECMILGNRLLAQWALVNECPFLYRNHRKRLASPSARDLSEQIQVDSLDAAAAFDSVEQRLQVLMGPAQYSAAADGHFALNLPQYAHCTSPLRRYVDLVNQRQLLAALDQQPTPYSQAQLLGLSEHLNETLQAIKVERAEAMKDAVRSRAARAITPAQVERLDAPGLVQALKMGASRGDIPDVVAQTLAQRMQGGLLEDKVHCALMEASLRLQRQQPPRALPAKLLEAWSAYYSSTPERAKMVLLFAQQSGFAESLDVSAQPDQGGFVADARIVRICDRAPLSARACGTRKKSAENLAVARLVCAFVGAPNPAPDPAPDSTPKAGAAQQPAPEPVKPPLADASDGTNPKGKLLEICQKSRWPAASFEVSSSGPDHSRLFVARVTLTRDAQPALVVKGAPAASKKSAEALAAQAALAALASRPAA